MPIIMVIRSNWRAFLILAPAIWVSYSVAGQPTDVVLNTVTITNLTNSEASDYDCSFHIYPNDRIEWTQSQSTVSFSILSTEGQYPDTSTGVITYHIGKEGIAGLITVENTGTGLAFLILDLTAGNPLGAHYKFSLTHL